MKDRLIAAAEIGVLALVLQGCGDKTPTTSSTLPSNSPIPTAINSENPTITVPSESPTVGPTAETTTSPEAQAQLEKAAKDWLDGTTPLPEAMSHTGVKFPFHITEAAIDVENIAADPGANPNAEVNYQVAFLKDFLLNNCLVIMGGTQNDDTAKTRDVLFYNFGKISEIMGINRYDSYVIGSRPNSYTEVLISSELNELATLNGKAIQITANVTPIDSSILTAKKFDPSINDGMTNSLATALWDAKTAWPGSKQTPPPSGDIILTKPSDIINIPTVLDTSKLIPAKTISIVTPQA